MPGPGFDTWPGHSQVPTGTFRAECITNDLSITFTAYYSQQYGLSLKCWRGKESRAVDHFGNKTPNQTRLHIDYCWLSTINKNTFT